MFYRTKMTSFQKVEIFDLCVTLNAENFMTKCSKQSSAQAICSWAQQIKFSSNSNDFNLLFYMYVWFYGVLLEITCYCKRSTHTSELIETFINSLLDIVTHSLMQNRNDTKTNANCQFIFQNSFDITKGIYKDWC